jgi:hypothetical protein
MREIKFRAWDGYKMQTEFSIDSDDGTPRLRHYCIHGEPNDVALNFKLMQYTGLKDKNGVEIYEECEINKKYIVSKNKVNYVLINISSGDIIDFYNYYLQIANGVEITRDYSPLSEDQKRACYESLPQNEI